MTESCETTGGGVCKEIQLGQIRPKNALCVSLLSVFTCDTPDSDDGFAYADFDDFG